MNPFFSQNNPNSCLPNIYLQASDEIINRAGIVFKFLKRTVANQDIILGDTLISSFTSAIDITLKLENYSGFDTESNLFESFGFTMNAQLTFLISEIALNGLIIQEDDLIYHESGKIFEIKDVKNIKTFHHFGVANNYNRLICEPFDKNDENFSTGVDEIDEIDELSDTNTDDEENEFSNLRSLFMDE